MEILKLKPPREEGEFYKWLKIKSEEAWEKVEIDKGIYGFQIQKNTKWLKGLSDGEIEEYESVLRVKFPRSYKLFLRNMNGTDKLGVNVYAQDGNSYSFNPMYYSYPRDLEIVKDCINWVYQSYKITFEFILHNSIANILPIVGHRFLVLNDCSFNPILSIYGNDCVFWDTSLRNFLLNDIFKLSNPPILFTSNRVKFWLDNGDFTALVDI